MPSLVLLAFGISKIVNETNYKENVDLSSWGLDKIPFFL